MGLPIDILKLLTGQTIEWDRIEFKKGWNPEPILHTICAFANDINNWGGGYIIVGVEEKNGRPILPPIGLELDTIDAIQKSLQELCHKIQPNYFPVTIPTMVEGKWIFVIWVAGGDNRPYKAPKLLRKGGQAFHYVRRGSVTKIAKDDVSRQLFELAAKVPFDDRINHHASIDDINFQLIRSFLRKVNSDLYANSETIQFKDLCRQMQIVRGPDENLRPLNIGLLLFSLNPTQFFRGAKIEIITYSDESGNNFQEKTFKGPIHLQFQDALSYFQNTVIKEEVQKVSEGVETKRFFNYPLQVIREVLANAVFHRSYEDHNPIEINIWPDRIEILSYPGPLPPVDNKTLARRRVVARNYRNRRLGDFLKELRYTESRGTGIPKVWDTLENNGSPQPKFETDDNTMYFLVTLPVHPFFRAFSATQLKEIALSPRELNILKYCYTPRKRREVLAHINLSNHTSNYGKYMLPLIRRELLIMTNPDRPTSKIQRYITNPAGLKFVRKLFGETPDQDNS